MASMSLKGDGVIEMPALARDVLTFLGAALGYYACAVIGTLLSLPPSGFAIIWPATAFLISLLLIAPPKRWWLCVAGVVPAHFYLAATLQPHAPFPVVLTQIGGNLVLAFATAIAVHIAIGKRHVFDTVGSVLTFMLVAGLAVPAIVNALILCVHFATGWIDDVWFSWRQWMIAGIFPTVTIPPVLILAANGRLTGQPTASSHPRRELAVLVASVFGLSFFVFGERFDASHWPALFLAPLPLLLWAAVRFGVGGTSLSLLAFAMAIIAHALGQSGPFAIHSPTTEITSLQVFLITTSIPLILLSALMDERRRTANILRLSEARMQAAAASTDTGLWQWDEGAQQLWLTEHCRHMFGLTTPAILTPFSLLAAVHPEDRTRMENALRAALTTADARPEENYRIICKGEVRWLLMSTYSEFDKAGKVQVSGVFRDVTDRVLAQLEVDQLRQRLIRIREDERRRIAEELHDSTAQHLVAARLDLSALKTKVRAATTRGLLARVIKSVHEASLEIRTFSYLLNPPQLGDGGIVRVLHQYMPGFESRTGVRTALRINPLADLLPPEQQHAILRIAQESLGNVHRHARAGRVSVSVRCISGNVHLVVCDDGKGIAPEEGRQLSERLHVGVGIPGMTARVRRLRDRIDVSKGAKGTTVHVAIPLPQLSASRLH